jgi:hypothetical protein
VAARCNCSIGHARPEEGDNQFEPLHIGWSKSHGNFLADLEPNTDSPSKFAAFHIHPIFVAESGTDQMESVAFRPKLAVVYIPLILVVVAVGTDRMEFAVFRIRLNLAAVHVLAVVVGVKIGRVVVLRIPPTTEDIPVVKVRPGKAPVEVESQSLDLEEDQVDIQLMVRRTVSSTW